jgi:hypothetical protein
MKGITAMDQIERNIRNLPDEELIKMVRIDFNEYTDVALFIARDEMSKRNIPEDAPLTEFEEDDDAEQSGDEHSSNSHALKLNAILQEELQFAESYNAILDFVTAMNIRNGEYEGTNTIFKKMDRENFILYSEQMNRDYSRTIKGSIAIGRKELASRIEEFGKTNGFTEEEAEELD